MTSSSVTGRSAVIAFLLIVWHLKAVRRVLLGVAVLAVLVLGTHHYGSSDTMNQGWTFGTDSHYIGFETVGDPGVFGQVSTAFGVVNLFDGAVSWCPAGASDVECGA